MGSKKGLERNKKLSQESQEALAKLEATTNKLIRFEFGKIKDGDDVPRFYFRPPRPRAEGVPLQICRQDTATLALTLRQEHAESEYMAWFWVAQLMHYGLYDTSVKSRYVRKVINRCKDILLDMSERNTLRVPQSISQRETELRVAHQRNEEEILVRAQLEEESRNNPIAVSNGMTAGLEGDHGNFDLGANASNDRDHVNSRYDVRVTTDPTSVTSIIPQDFPDKGRLTIREYDILHAWRDDFCTRHGITRVDFQVLMTESRFGGNSAWGYDFITKDEFVDEFVARLPHRDRACLLRVRRYYNWNPPGVSDPVVFAPSIHQAHQHNLVNEDIETSITEDEKEESGSHGGQARANVRGTRTIDSLFAEDVGGRTAVRHDLALRTAEGSIASLSPTIASVNGQATSEPPTDQEDLSNEATDSSKAESYSTDSEEDDSSEESEESDIGEIHHGNDHKDLPMQQMSSNSQAVDYCLASLERIAIHGRVCSSHVGRDGQPTIPSVKGTRMSGTNRGGTHPVRDLDMSDANFGSQLRQSRSPADATSA